MLIQIYKEQLFSSKMQAKRNFWLVLKESKSCLLCFILLCSSMHYSSLVQGCRYPTTLRNKCKYDGKILSMVEQYSDSAGIGGVIFLYRCKIWTQHVKRGLMHGDKTFKLKRKKWNLIFKVNILFLLFQQRTKTFFAFPQKTKTFFAFPQKQKRKIYSQRVFGL